MGAWIGERAAGDKALLKTDDAVKRIEPLLRLDDLPSRDIAKTDFKNIEIEGGIEIIAERTFAGEIIDPGDDAAFVIDIVVQRHRDLGLVGAAADLVAGVQIQQRLLQDRAIRASLRRG